MIILAFSIVLIVAMCVKGWQIALTDKLYDDAEQYAEQRYREKIANTKYRVWSAIRIVDETQRG